MKADRSPIAGPTGSAISCKAASISRPAPVPTDKGRHEEGLGFASPRLWRFRPSHRREAANCKRPWLIQALRGVERGGRLLRPENL
jgi:hypothetical protein